VNLVIIIINKQQLQVCALFSGSGGSKMNKTTGTQMPSVALDLPSIGLGCGAV
jgi:hypothetical protein